MAVTSRGCCESFELDCEMGQLSQRLGELTAGLTGNGVRELGAGQMASSIVFPSYAKMDCGHMNRTLGVSRRFAAVLSLLLTVAVVAVHVHKFRIAPPPHFVRQL